MRLTVSCLLVVLTAAPLPAGAQVRRSGLWGGASVSLGVRNLSCGACDNEGANLASHLGLRLGITLRPDVLLAFEMNASGQPGSPDMIAQFGAVGYWYPRASRPWYLKGGAGYSLFRGEQRGEVAETGSGAGFLLGGGLDIPIGKSASLGPVVTISYDGVGDTHLAGGIKRIGVSAFTAVLGAALTFH